MPNTIEIITLAYVATSSLRVVAYLPQIVRLVQDTSTATDVSCSTWLLFLLSNATTAAYAAIVLDEFSMTLIFTANALCSGAIAMLAMARRVRLRPHEFIAGSRPN